MFRSGLVLLALTLSSFSWAAAPFADDDFKNSEAGIAFDKFMSQLDLEDPKYIFELKTSSTSVGIKLSVEKVDEAGNKKTKKLGTWLPTNAAGDPEAQVVAYYLSQFLHMSDIVLPSEYLVLGPTATTRFMAMLDCTLSTVDIWQNNCKNLITLYGTVLEGIDGVMRDHVKGEVEVPNMILPAYPDGTLNTDHIIARFINATGPMPSATKQMSLGVQFEDPNDETKMIEPTETELNLARQFSQIMVLDVLTGQWDRFSGANIEAVYNKKKNTVQFIARDNGGASMYVDGSDVYYTFLSRFDAAQIKRVERLLSLLESHPLEVHEALHIRSGVEALVRRCKLLLSHVKAVETIHGKDKVYFPAN